MKKLKVIILSITIIGMFTFPINVMADELLNSNEAADSMTSLQENVNDENIDENLKTTSEFKEESKELPIGDSQINSVSKTDIAKPTSDLKNTPPELTQNPANKNFTLTKTSGGVETKINDYDKFSETVSAMDINDVDSLYTIYVNRDVIIPKTDHSTYRSNNKIRLTSKNGGHFKLTREGEEDYIAIQTNAELTVDNITLDGNNDGQCFFISNNGKITIGKDTVVQNFIDSPKFDGPPIYMTGGTLNILAGAVIQNNTSNQQGGVIQAYHGTNLNISGGSFINNKSNKSDGGAIATYGKLNITGGVFENNVAKKTGGAIIAGSRADATIKNATFKNNQASTGGAIYSGNKITISDSSFENNQANWAGAVFAGKDIDLSNVKFIKNKVANQGGALYLNSGNSSLNKCVFNENLSNSQGGAIFIKTANTKIEASEFKGNGAESGGGSIFVDHNNMGMTKLSKSSFADNYSNAFGGGVYLGLNSKLDVVDSSFSNNQAVYGAGISSAASGDLDKNLTNIKVDDTIFDNNKSLMGAGIFTSFPTEILNSTFTNNEAIVSKNDVQSNPHFSGVGGAVQVIDNKTVIKGTTFKENIAGGSGGAIGINGVIRNENGEITGIKDNLKVEISDSTKFISNTCKVGQGGAIYTIPYQYDLEDQKISENVLKTFKEKVYKNLTIDKTTLFKGNLSESGLFNPPENYKDFTNLQFSEESDVPHGEHMYKSLLNNYDINYKGRLLIIYDANGGKFSDGTKIKQEMHNKDENIQIMKAPTREGYQFLYWKWNDSEYNPGENYKIVDNHTFVAQWNKIPELTVKDATISTGEKIDLRTLIDKARDEEDGENLIDKVVIDKGSFDSNKAGKYEIKFTLTDSNGASVTQVSTVIVQAKEIPNKPEQATPKAETSKSNPKTGDASEITSYVILAGLLTLICKLIHKKKNGNFS